MSSLNQNVVRHKIGLLNLATELGNVSRACKLMGLSRDTFYRYQNAMADGVEALLDANRRRPNPKNRVEEATEAARRKQDTINSGSTTRPACSMTG
jgi:molybdenum-dependent DNA-binding transcriptional regulator ModE